MTDQYVGEVWKTIVFDFEYTNQNRIEISNFGRMRTFNKISTGRFLKPQHVNGYEIVRLKFFKPRDAEADEQLNEYKAKAFALARELKQLEESGASTEDVAAMQKQLLSFKKKMSKKFAEATKKRTIYFQSLVHRLVAQNFLPPPAANQTLVAHLDYEKLNNRAHNLKWMSPDENYIHQQKSPYVINDKYERKHGLEAKARTSKLTITRVMLLKKMLNQNKPMKQLVKQFKITDTQILRIKRGENWANVPAAT